MAAGAQTLGGPLCRMQWRLEDENGDAFYEWYEGEVLAPPHLTPPP